MLFSSLYNPAHWAKFNSDSQFPEQDFPCDFKIQFWLDRIPVKISYFKYGNFLNRICTTDTRKTGTQIEMLQSSYFGETFLPKSFTLRPNHLPFTFLCLWFRPGCRVYSVLEHQSRDQRVSTAVELRRSSDWTKRCQIQMRGGNKKLILTWWRHKSSSARLYHTEITRIIVEILFLTSLYTIVPQF